MPEVRPERVVVVGASAGGLAAAEALRSFGFGGEIVMIGDEEHLPYDRPPLSKELLSGKWEPDRVFLKSDENLAKLRLDLRLGRAVTGLDTARHEVTLADGSSVGYDRLVIATGVSPRWIPGHENRTGMHVLRTIDDALALKSTLTPSARLAIVGAGVLGAESAAVATGLGVNVTLVDSVDYPLARVVAPPIGRLLTEMHRTHGVDVRLGVGVDAVDVVDDRAVALRLGDGTRVAADTFLVAIGATPVTSWITDAAVTVGGRAPADGAGGIQCDDRGRAADDVYAVGDVAAWWNPRTSSYRRMEHRLSATEQGRIVARTITDPGYVPDEVLPYFWSDQYDLKLQTYGAPNVAGDDFTVVDGSLDSQKFIATYTRDGHLTGVVGAGMFRALKEWRQRLIDSQAPAHNQ